ncbi:hypothetical protein [Fuchsiella alkaliacetigena]|uniref:hypothetical protein n=1 Tax=Fuchsiella alkaliacetigena TaxID=957042 RepID=UPI00200B2CC7|nr:hypothetical protein [Fuchsiella alkaliacetigena]MCK8825810.1 hypothetical protein [Fuchsiella alkaliacetigena]
MLILLTIVNLLATLILFFYILKIEEKISIKDEKLEEILAFMKKFSNDDDQSQEQEKTEDEYIEQLKNSKLGDNNILTKLVLKDKFDNQPADPQTFERYVTHLFEEVAATEDVQKKKSYLEEADQVLSTFSGQANPADLELAVKYEDKLAEVREELPESEGADTESSNQETLNQLKALVEKLRDAATQEDAERILEKATKLEEELDLESFTEEDEELYKELQSSVKRLTTTEVLGATPSLSLKE